MKKKAKVQHDLQAQSFRRNGEVQAFFLSVRFLFVSTGKDIHSLGTLFTFYSDVFSVFCLYAKPD